MKQIKTIVRPMISLRGRTYAEIFDDEVNAAIAEGWTLCERKVTTDGKLIAELEKEIITEAERCCENCLHYNLKPGQEPCASCVEGELWEEGDA